MALDRQRRVQIYADKLRAEVDALEAAGVVMAGNACSPVLLVKGEPTPEEAAGARLLAGADGKALRAALEALGYAPEEWAGLATWRADATHPTARGSRANDMPQLAQPTDAARADGATPLPSQAEGASSSGDATPQPAPLANADAAASDSHADVDAHAGATLDPALLRQAIMALDPHTLVLCDELAVLAVREAYVDELCAKDQIDHALLAEGVLVDLLGMRVMSLGGFAAGLADDSRKQRMWYYLKQLPPLGEPY